MIPYFRVETISIGPATINMWGLLVSVALLVGWWLVRRSARQLQADGETAGDLVLLVFGGGLIGARLFYVFNEWQTFVDDPSVIWRIWDGGMAIYGGLIGGALTGWFFLRWRGLPILPYADIIARTLPITIAIGRVGCLLIHDHLGSLTAQPWGQQLAGGSVRHELALYEIVFMLGLSVVLNLRTRWWQRPGQPTLVFLFSYGLFRFLADFLRARDLVGADPVGWLGLHPSQWVAGLSVVLAIYVFWRQGHLSKSPEKRHPHF